MSRELFAQDTLRAAAKRAFLSARLIWPLMEGAWLPLLLAYPLLALGYLRVLQLSGGGRMSMFDLYVRAYSPTYGIPLLWLVCPIITMIVLARVWGIRDSCNIAVRSGGRGAIWLTRMCDLAVVSAASAVIIHLSLLIVGAIFIGNPSDVADPLSRFAAATDGRTLQGFSFPAASALLLAYCFLVLLFENSLFLLFRNVAGAIPAAAVVVVLSYPEVHKTSAFISDLVGALGGDALAVNPLSRLYETANVYYPSWLPGGAHDLWFLGLLAAVVAVMARLVCRKRDHL